MINVCEIWSDYEMSTLVAKSFVPRVKPYLCHMYSPSVQTLSSTWNVEAHFKAKLFLFQRAEKFQHLSCDCTDASSSYLCYKTQQFSATRFLIFYYLLLSVRSACIMQWIFGTGEMICCRHSGLLPPGQAVWWRGGGSIGRERERIGVRQGEGEQG